MRSFFLLLLDLAPVPLEGSELDTLEADDEVVGEDDFEGEAGEEGGGAEEEAEQVLLEAELDGLQGLAAVLDHGELDDDGGDHDHQEQLVVEEVLEDVVLVVLQLTGVDLVEDLQQHEDVEEDGVVLAGLVIPVAHADGGGDAEEFGACVRT